jgi:YjbE family integral membrane protein
VAPGVLLVDILLSGDNAIVIAMVCRTLSKEHRTKALWLGVIGAFLARLVLTSCATLAMHLPLIKLIGGLLLLKISIELIVDNAHQGPNSPQPQHSSANDIFYAARTIVLADVVMSLDNVLVKWTPESGQT